MQWSIQLDSDFNFHIYSKWKTNNNKRGGDTATVNQSRAIASNGKIAFEIDLTSMMYREDDDNDDNTIITNKL